MPSNNTSATNNTPKPHPTGNYNIQLPGLGMSSQPAPQQVPYMVPQQYGMQNPQMIAMSTGYVNPNYANMVNSNPQMVQQPSYISPAYVNPNFLAQRMGATNMQTMQTGKF